jgi:transposase-like protein
MPRPFDPSTFPPRWRDPHGRAALAAWQASGLSVRAFARQHGLRDKRLYRWFRRLGAWPPSPPKPPAFVEVVVPAPPPVPEEPFVVELGDVVIRVPHRFERSALLDLVSVLRC